MKKFFPYLFFICFGTTCEIFFVAFTNLFNNTPFCNEPLWSLTGKTYVWMAPLYAVIPFAYDLVFPKLEKLHILIRLLICVLGIYVIEFSSGFILEQVTGRCPWEYTVGWHIMGYIRLDYFPAWFFFAFIIERLYVFVKGLTA